MTSSRKRRTPSAGVLADALDAELRRASDPERAANEKAYLKSPLQHYGVRVPTVRKALASVLKEAGELSHRQLLALTRRLWKSWVHEHRMAAVMTLEQHAEQLEPADLSLVEEMIRGSFTWAYVDGLAARVAGSLVEGNPQLADELDTWAEDESFWVRRAALLALMGPIRRGGGDWRRFTRYADAMLDEREFFIRKAIGWVLREASKKRPGRTRQYVETRRDRLSRVTFREAVRRLPPTDRKRLKKAYEAGRRAKIVRRTPR